MRSYRSRIWLERDLDLRASGVSGGDAPLPTLEVSEEEETSIRTPWRVILYNDDVHTFDEVIRQLIIATRCSQVRAEGLAWEVHTKGKATVFESDFEECFRVQSILREIELITELRG